MWSLHQVKHFGRWSWLSSHGPFGLTSQAGGGGTIVQDFTGIEFADGTSVGAGQVLEFYVNFGTWGVIGGFLLFGWLIGQWISCHKIS